MGKPWACMTIRDCMMEFCREWCLTLSIAIGFSRTMPKQTAPFVSYPAPTNSAGTPNLGKASKTRSRWKCQPVSPSSFTATSGMALFPVLILVFAYLSIPVTAVGISVVRKTFRDRSLRKCWHATMSGFASWWAMMMSGDILMNGAPFHTA